MSSQLTPPPALSAAATAALLVDTTPYLSCDECFERMDTHVEALLADPGDHDPAMEHHLAGCAACHEEADSLIALLTAD
ncbi:hypothetical protein ACOCJ5_15400 [Knoellia sp. CPCC 206450]|uniref:hypothetical protein n=1 Tax=Knoellia tibetensis TaxID=3404798 RepID=UPI003B43034C